MSKIGFIRNYLLWKTCCFWVVKCEIYLQVTSYTAVLLIAWRHQEAVVQKCSVKKILLEIPENSQENTCDRVSFLIKLQAATLLKEKLWHRCLPVNFLKFLRTPFLTEHLWWLLQVILMQLRKATGNALELNTLMLSKTWI